MGDFMKRDRLDRKDKRHPVSLGKRQVLSTFPLRGRRFRIHGHLGGRRKRPQAGRAAGGRVWARYGQQMSTACRVSGRRALGVETIPEGGGRLFPGT
jgi:hypothetical protein